MICSIFYCCGDMETVVDVDIPPHNSVLVLTGELITDSEVRVLVSHSVGAFEQTIPSYITDAEVLLYENGIFIDTLTLDSINTDTVVFYNNYGENELLMNYYTSDLVPVSGSTYKIEVYHSDYNNISSSTYIPEDVVIYNILIDTVTNEENIGISFSFNDNGTQKNYYRLKLFSQCLKYWYNELGYYEEYEYSGYAEMMSNDPSFPGEIPFEGYTFFGNEVVFTDDLFNGDQKNISLDIDSYGYRYSDCDTVTIKFSTFSDDTYTYYNSLGDHREKGGLGLFGGEVIPVYSNVEGGLGILISTNSQNINLKP